MTTEENWKKLDAWSISSGVVSGLGVLGYVYAQHENYGEMIAFPLMFFPMLATLGVAAIAHFVFWLATGHTPKKNSPGALTNSELLARASQLDKRRWLVTVYHCLQSITMVGAGYIATCPVIGIFLLK